MKLVKNAAGRLFPTEVNGQEQIPFQGMNKFKPLVTKQSLQLEVAMIIPLMEIKLLKI